MATTYRRRYIGVATLAILLASISAVFIFRQQLLDWVHLYGYSPPAAVKQLAVSDMMTPYAERLFYVNRPSISRSSDFTIHCPSGTEKTVVLGCYRSPDEGIYLYDVTDKRLAGVEQVTAAHEMLHAAYRRLSPAERTSIDNLLTDYYNNHLTDQRVKDTIAAYRVSEPKDVVNEMHSIFGTEITSLPPALERYYQQYFINRTKITGYTEAYQSEFSIRQTQIAAYDAQLARLKTQISDSEQSLADQKKELDSQDQSLQRNRTSGNIAAYNQGVAPYNSAVNNYNSAVAATKALITQYNDIVNQRNAIALEQQQLVQAISGTAQPV